MLAEQGKRQDGSGREIERFRGRPDQGFTPDKPAARRAPRTLGEHYVEPTHIKQLDQLGGQSDLHIFGGNFAVVSLWLPELFGTEVRASAFAFCTSVGRFAGAGVNFLLAWAVSSMGTLGTPVALTAIAFAVGLLVVPFARETRGQVLPE